MATGEPSADSPASPQYEEMISAAIEALNDKNGCSKTAISYYIESTYNDLPAAHLTLLSHHLDRMSQSGELTIVKNNYLKSAAATGAGPAPPQKRGRGRPPKPKVASPPGSVASPQPSSRPRGRPPKSRDPFAPLPLPKKAKTASSPGSGRPRGRPPKKDKSDVPVAASPVAGTPRPRGRPPKVKPSVAAVGC